MADTTTNHLTSTVSTRYPVTCQRFSDVSINQPKKKQPNFFQGSFLTILVAAPTSTMGKNRSEVCSAVMCSMRSKYSAEKY